ncbi:MAG: hypothetical protein OMM_00763 [Candidatus Magnetoglobus multicellularis str. Araruama]|uniref:Outer membrane protein beta-barrel domain-containing protein n=1 Tax=Candidatus Magnetoglobus multicellularis str. Araruama TaxID=890399 RepID=A0A1V1PG98_9BACT|nr:MAG: hypothetical protein OMM_00763 [Candidatus Magnetoglobus multicellularis str. Araruama]
MLDKNKKMYLIDLIIINQQSNIKKNGEIMRKFLLICIVCLSVLTTIGSQEIFAQEKTSFYIGASLSNTWSQLDEAHTKQFFYNNVGVDFDDSFGFKLRGGLILNEYFTAEGMLEYVTPFESDVSNIRGNYKTKIDVFTVGANAKCTLPLKENLVPYALFGMGLFNSYEKITGPYFKKKTDWGIGSRLAIGADIIHEHNYSVGMELEHVLGFGNVDHIQYTNISIGAAYRF